MFESKFPSWPVGSCDALVASGGSGPVLSLTKRGPGKLILNGAVSPTGTILLNACTVLINNSST